MMTKYTKHATWRQSKHQKVQLQKTSLPEFEDNKNNLNLCPLAKLLPQTSRKPSGMELSTWLRPTNKVIKAEERNQKGLTCALQFHGGERRKARLNNSEKEQVRMNSWRDRRHEE